MTARTHLGRDTMAAALYQRGHIYTGQPSRPWADAMLVCCGRVVWAGAASELGTGLPAEPVDLAGATVLPGLTDAHTHLLYHALLAQRINLRASRSLAQALAAIAAYARAHPERAWILGHGWNENLWPEGRLPNRADLESAVPDRPAVLTRADYHLAWANSRALQAAGVTAGTADPPGGRVERDEHGEPTGILRERAAALVLDVAPSPSLSERTQALLAAQAEAHGLGLVGVHTMEGAECLEALQDLRAHGELSLRVLVVPPYHLLPELRALGLRPGFGDEWLRLGQLKLFADGSLGSHTAWMLQPFQDDPANLGMPANSPDELERLIREAHGAGWPCAVHAIGDAANRAVLGAIERAGRSPSSLPDRIEHVQIIQPEDMPRLPRLGVVASMQPVHVASDWAVASRLWGERARFSYAWRSLLAHGAVLAFGSDAPVEPLNPWAGLQVAVTRRDLAGQPPDGWYPGERLTLAEALAGFSSGAAFAAGEPRQGALAPGCRADFVLLERDPFTVPPEELGQLRPMATFVAGNRVCPA
jgi:predicted amidohydrolase YtcJ